MSSQGPVAVYIFGLLLFLSFDGFKSSASFSQDPGFRAIIVTIFILSVLHFCQTAEHVLHFFQ
jgi:hypothetical protein